MLRFQVVAVCLLVLGQVTQAQNKPVGGDIKKLAEKAKPKENPDQAVGNVALEIEGEDVDGHFFRLSDYRGKIVVLDFWGNW
jgi:hypothetical protein